jgi:hypothetical protein
MKKLLAAWLCAVVVACAASPKQSTTTPAPPTMAPAMPANSHDEIERLANEIDQQRTQMNLPAPAPLPAPAEPMAAHTSAMTPVPPPHAQDPTCHPAPSQTCTDSCTLGDSICGNADKICKLADGMPGDDWAAGKCSTAKQTCSDAHKRCCECT